VAGARQEVAPYLQDLFSLRGRVAVVTGATGVLGGAMAEGLARAGARVGVLGRRDEKAREVTEEIGASGGEAMALPADVLDRGRLEAACDAVLDRWGRVDILVNAAGGNVPDATVGDEESFFELSKEAFGEVFDLNLLGTVLPTQVFGEAMVRKHAESANGAEGSVVNVSSMAAQRPLTRVVSYAAAKAAVENLTRWLSVELARKHGPGLRVNAVAPGFFLGEQNRDLLLNKDGSLTERGRTIIDHTPARRFGKPEELVSTLLWLCSPASNFVNGIVVPVDGGFNAFSGV
jgi:NAD(P)-dependent dehydrogenase (short-subunit alcohol dehydrogenase family)